MNNTHAEEPAPQGNPIASPVSQNPGAGSSLSHRTAQKQTPGVQNDQEALWCSPHNTSEMIVSEIPMIVGQNLHLPWVRNHNSKPVYNLYLYQEIKF
jgi:hypothetical protein